MRILVIQQKRIGDVLTSTIICNNLKAKFPDSTIDYMCYPNSIDVLKENPNIDNIIPVTNKIRKSTLGFIKFIFEIRRKKYDAVIDVYSKLGTNLITFFSGAKYKVSYHKWYSNIFYNYSYERFDAIKSEYGLAIENRLLLLKPFFTEKIRNVKPKIFLKESEITEAKNILNSYNIDPEKPLIMFGILGSEHYKTYPLDGMAKIIDFTVAKTNATILFNYIPNQKEQALEVYNHCSEETKKHIIFDLYATDLRQFLAILSQCEMLIGNEGGAVNMAKALEIPTFSIFTPSVRKETWQLFENEAKNVSVHLKDLKPEIYEKHTEQYIKEHTFEYYAEYPLELILKKLETYFQEYKN
ncbi:glycosyltransferase family 9 protein [Flavobacterium ustbae]|uniref:glycosyltransferase family 9 protein n=1 Tax=Flavobacterium ustbae TaxID=2488790 RepID=UPI000F78DFA9|nr:glycosyltransferase family 9 protein [Flavobacterium ustbae]